MKFTGSTLAGSQIAEICGKHLKKSTLELGGNDPFCVLKDADIAKAVEIAYKSRMAANGQACINAKRFIIEGAVYDQFKD